MWCRCCSGWRRGCDPGWVCRGLLVTGRYVGSASLFARVAHTRSDRELASPAQLVMRDPQLPDGALAEAARWAGVSVSDPDSTPGAPRRTGGAGG
jgi:hypothetical protein